MKKSKLLIVLILIMIVTLTGSGCKKNLNYKIKFYDIGSTNAFSYTNKEYSKVSDDSLTTLIKNHEDLRVMCDEYNNPAFDESSDKYNNEINQMIRTFSNEYFKDKALIIIFGQCVKPGGHINGIESISINYDEVVINCLTAYAPVMPAYIDSRLFMLIIEINQKDVKNVNYINLSFRKVEAVINDNVKIIDGKVYIKSKRD